jgi:hypothetical protein
MSKIVKIGARGHPLKGKKGETLYEVEVREEGRANNNWLRAYELTKFNAPHAWFEALSPVLNLSVDHP